MFLCERRAVETRAVERQCVFDSRLIFYFLSKEVNFAPLTFNVEIHDTELL